MGKISWVRQGAQGGAISQVKPRARPVLHSPTPNPLGQGPLRGGGAFLSQGETEWLQPALGLHQTLPSLLQLGFLVLGSPQEAAGTPRLGARLGSGCLGWVVWPLGHCWQLLALPRSLQVSHSCGHLCQLCQGQWVARVGSCSVVGTRVQKTVCHQYHH